MTAVSTTVHPVIWHPDGRRVLRCGAGWPVLELQEDQGIRQGIEANWNLAAWLLHDGGLSAGRHGQPRLQLSSPEIPDGMYWEEVEVPLLPNARPWQLPGWPAQAQERFDSALKNSVLKNTALKADGLKKLDGLSVTDVNDLACIMRAATNKGPVYLKVGDSSREAAVTRHLSTTLPELLPPILWADPASNSLLSLSGGEWLERVNELNAWTGALQRLAQFQRKADAGALSALGCPSFPLLQMAERVDSLLSDGEGLRAWGVQEDCLGTLNEARPAIGAAFCELSALNLPELPAHGDAHPRNALSGPRGSIWFDWAETASAAHPFMDAGWFLAFTFHSSQAAWAIKKAHSDLERQFSVAYLSALGCPDAVHLLRRAVPLALLHRAVVYDARFRHWEGTVPGWRPNFVPYYLRLAARELARLRS